MAATPRRRQVLAVPRRNLVGPPFGAAEAGEEAPQPGSRQPIAPFQLKTRDYAAAQRILPTGNESEAQPQLNVALPVCSFQTILSL